MIRVEYTRRIDCNPGRGKSRVSNTGTYNCTNGAEALVEIARSRDASEEIAPGYMPMIEIRLYDLEPYLAWVRSGGEMPKPLRVLNAAEIAALPSPPTEEELRRSADRIDGYDRDDLGESPDF